jgi:hypothetical protein
MRYEAGKPWIDVMAHIPKTLMEREGLKRPRAEIRSL